LNWFFPEPHPAYQGLSLSPPAELPASAAT
jgi:hypothetical protein